MSQRTITHTDFEPQKEIPNYDGKALYHFSDRKLYTRYPDYSSWLALEFPPYPDLRMDPEIEQDLESIFTKWIGL